MTPSSRCVSWICPVCRAPNGTGSTTTRSTRTASVWSRPTATAADRTVSRSSSSRTSRQWGERVSPWLTLDGNSSPAVVNGRVQWIIDGYTTSADYPYSRLQQINNVTADSLTARTSSVQALQAAQVNYIRNSVKATVDAYDGSVKLYAWDNQDPLLKAWSKAFGG